MKVSYLAYFLALAFGVFTIAKATSVQLSSSGKHKAKVISRNSRSALVELEIPFKSGMYGLEGDILHLKLTKASDILAVSPITGSYFSGGSKFSQSSESFICEDIKIGKLPKGFKLSSIKFLIKFAFSKNNRGFDLSKDLKSCLLTRIRKTKAPTIAPTAAAVPSKAPTKAPTSKKTNAPTAAVPSRAPTKKTASPTSAFVPSTAPTYKKTKAPTSAAVPSRAPTKRMPTHAPTWKFPIKSFEKCRTSQIALSFEDTIETSDWQISQILDTLYHLEMKATFFMAPFDSNEGKCELIPRMLAEGHQVGCTSATMNDFLSLDLQENEFISQEIEPCIDWIRECSGENYEATQFRPPRGECSKEQAKWISSRGYTVPLWNFDLGDYEPSDFDEKATVLNNFNRMMLDYRMLNNDEDPSSMSIRVPDIGEFLRRDDDEGAEFLNEFKMLYGPEYDFVTCDECWDKCEKSDQGLCEDHIKNHYSMEYWKNDN